MAEQRHPPPAQRAAPFVRFQQHINARFHRASVWPRGAPETSAESDLGVAQFPGNRAVGEAGRSPAGA
jgi:hypothetical protein